MRLASIKVKNFRCFEEADVPVHAQGLIGVRGPNGTGKSSLFEALEFALYGKRAGRSSLPVRRTGASDDDEPTWVKVEFSFGEHFFEVERTESTARFVMDGEPLATSLTSATKETIRQLGLTRDQFSATFYARQREIAAFSRPDQRRDNIERLLGLTQARNAAGLARDDAKTQAAVVSALANEREDLGEARRTLEQLREQVKQTAPAAEEARQRRDDLKVERTQTWATFNEAQQRAESAQEARAAASLAAEREASARVQLEQATQSLHEAEAAAAELQMHQPLAQTLSERRAQVSELNTRAQAYQQFLDAREARADAQRRRAALEDELAALPTPTPSAADLMAELSELHRQRDRATSELLKLNERIQDLSERKGAADRAAAARRRSAWLAQQLQPVADLSAEQQAGRQQHATLRAQQVEYERALAAEAAHFEEVKRDGPDSQCMRCRRPYGDRYQDILREFTAVIADLKQKADSTSNALGKTVRRQAELDQRVDELRRLEGELASLAIPDDAEDPEVLETELTGAREQAESLRRQIDAYSTRTKALEQAHERARVGEAQRHTLLDEVAHAHAQETAFAQQLAGMTVDSYNEQEHMQARARLDEAQAAFDRCASLQATAQQLQLRAARATGAQQALSEASHLASDAQALADGLGDCAAAVAVAKQRLVTLDERIEQAEADVARTEQQALSRSKDVQAAEQAVKRAQAQQRKLRAEQLESRYRDEIARLLELYAGHIQRRALPMVETETAQLLARLSGGRYEDVRLSDSAALEIYDDGAHHRLERFSGGEQDLANLCLRLALSRTFARQQGTDAGLIILDEVFGSQDLDRRKALLNQLRELEGEFSQVFIVSHFDDVVAGCDLEIEVTRANGFSVARPIEKSTV